MLGSGTQGCPRRWLAAAGWGIIASMSVAAPALADCKLLEAAELPVTMVGNSPLIPVSIDGHEVKMLLDTGAGRSSIWRSAAQELNLPIQHTDMRMYGAGGADNAGIVWVHDLKLAGASAQRVPLLAMGRGTSPENSAGILGEDILSKFDLELDLRGGKARLFTPKGCSGDQVVYWAKAYFMTKLTHTNSNSGWVRIGVSLDGHAADALLDTGASMSVITVQAIREARMNPESPLVQAGQAQGLAGKFDMSVAFFRVLTIGQETVQNAELNIADLFGKDTVVETKSLIAHQALDEPDMLLGADFLLAHRVYIARSQGKMYFTYEGGPIFQHRPPPASTTAEAGAPGAAGDAEADGKAKAAPEAAGDAKAAAGGSDGGGSPR